MNFQQAGFERAAREYEQVARDKVHVAVAQASERCRTEMWERKNALEKQAEQTVTSHQVTKLNEMSSVAGDAMENWRRSLINEATAELQRHQRHSQAGCSAPLV